jgi:hypothetical protein
MPREVNTLIIAERAAASNVIAPHRHLAQIVSERGHAQRKSIARAEVKRARELIGYGPDPGRMRVGIAFNHVSALAEAIENLDHIRLAVFNGVKGRHLSLVNSHFYCLL